MKKKSNVTRNNSKAETKNKKTPAKPTSRKRKKSDPTKQKSAARTSKVSKNNSTVQPSKRGRGRPRKKIPSESTPPDKSSISRKDPKQSLDIPLDTPTNLAGQYRFKPRTQVSIMAPIKKKKSRLRKMNDSSRDNQDLTTQVTDNSPVKKVQSGSVINKGKVNSASDVMNNTSLESDDIDNELIVHTEEDVPDEQLIDSKESNNDQEVITDTGNELKSKNNACTILNVIDKNTSSEIKCPATSEKKTNPFKDIKKDPSKYTKYKSNQNWQKRRRAQARHYVKTHNMDYNLVLKLLTNDQLLYDDLTKSITMNLNLIDSSDADNNTVDGDNKSFVVPSELKARILSTKGKNNTTQKYLLLSDDELAKLWLCRKFVFGNNVSPTPISQPSPTDTKVTSTELEDAASQEIENVDDERSVD